MVVRLSGKLFQCSVIFRICGDFPKPNQVVVVIKPKGVQRGQVRNLNRLGVNRTLGRGITSC